MAEQQDSPIKYAVVEYATNKHFFNVYDCIRIDRLQFEVVKYDREAGRHVDRAYCYLPVNRCRLLTHSILSRRCKVAGWKFEIFGGSKLDNGYLESRVMRVEYDPGEQGNFAKFPYRIIISVGPGKRTSTNGIAPDGPPLSKVDMRLPEEDILWICLEIDAFLLVHQREIEMVRRLEQEEKYDRRMERQADAYEPEPEPARQEPQRTAPACVRRHAHGWGRS